MTHQTTSETQYDKPNVDMVDAPPAYHDPHSSQTYQNPNYVPPQQQQQQMYTQPQYPTQQMYPQTSPPPPQQQQPYIVQQPMYPQQQAPAYQPQPQTQPVQTYNDYGSQDETMAMLMFFLGFFIGSIIVWSICFFMFRTSQSSKARLFAKLSLVLVLFYLGLFVLSTLSGIGVAIIYGIVFAIRFAK